MYRVISGSVQSGGMQVPLLSHVSCDHQCYDYSNGHICKRIHRVHSIWLQSNDIENSEHSSECDEETHDPLEISESATDIVAGN